jgi:hypothetical protein
MNVYVIIIHFSGHHEMKEKCICYIFYITDIIKIFLYHVWIFFSSVIQTNIGHSSENVNSSNEGRITP